MRRMFSSKWPKILTFSHKSTKGMKMSIEIPDEVLVLLQTGKAIEGTIKMNRSMGNVRSASELMLQAKELTDCLRHMMMTVEISEEEML